MDTPPPSLSKNELSRIPREVADVYGQIAADGAISESLRARHPIP